MPLASEILDWNTQLRNEFTNFFTAGQEIVDYMLPEHRDITDTRATGDRKNQRIFDSTAPESLFLVASFLSGAIFNEAFQWFDVRHVDEALNEDEEASEYFEAVKRAQFASFRQSNFYATPIELITDWLAFGNMCVLQERLDPDPFYGARIVFTPCGFGSYVFFEGKDKRPEGLIREIEMTAKDCEKKFGENKINHAMASALKQNKPFTKFHIVHAIFPRRMMNYRRLATPKEMPWASCWFDKQHPKDAPLLESGYHEKPFAIARYNVNAGEVLGRGLGNLALPHVKTLNRIIMRGFIDLDKSLDPPVDSEQGNIIGAYSHRPGARNILKRIEKTRTSESGLQARSRNQTYEWNVQDLRSTVQDIFLTRQIRELAGVMGGPVREKTAYQYAKELELLHMIMAPTGGRLQTEFLRDCVETNYAILFRTGQLPELPAVLKEAARTEQGNQTVVVYEGPLAQSQRSQQLGSMEEFIQNTMMKMQAWPNVASIPDIDEFIRKEAEIRGIQHLLHDPKKTDELNALKAQVEQLTQQLAIATQASEVAKNVGQAAAGFGTAAGATQQAA